MLGSFGDIPFEVPAAPSVARHTAAADWAFHEVIGGAPIREKVGEEAGELRLIVELQRRAAGSTINIEDRLERLRSAASDGEVRRLIIGDENFGQHVLESVDTEYERIVGGRAMKARVDLQFTEHN
jgi:phage protein U